MDIGQASLLDMHSVLNVLNVIQFELFNLGEKVGESEALEAISDHICEATQFLREPDKAMNLFQSVEAFGKDLDDRLGGLQETHDLGEHPDFRRTRANIAAICRILAVRADEILHRVENPRRWESFHNVQLRESLYDVFRAIEASGSHAYRIVFQPPEKEAGWYLIELEIKSRDDRTIELPPILVDTMRDLMANARKYTPPGGVIHARLIEESQRLRFSVRDTGRGIPADEIPDVVQFGIRGSNVRDRPTMGGGFGLTKAYFVTKMFGGRMWIESPCEDGIGTEIRIEIPRHGAAEPDAESDAAS